MLYSVKILLNSGGKKKDYGKVRHSEGVTEFLGGLAFRNEAFLSCKLTKLDYSI